MISEKHFADLCHAAGAVKVTTAAKKQFEANAQVWLTNTVKAAIQNMNNQGRTDVEAGDLPTTGL